MGLAVAVPGLLVGRVLARRQALLAIELDEVKNAVCAGAREVA
jgi:biopolymer transport protein ExbB/TolQ